MPDRIKIDNKKQAIQNVVQGVERALRDFRDSKGEGRKEKRCFEGALRVAESVSKQ